MDSLEYILFLCLIVRGIVGENQWIWNLKKDKNKINFNEEKRMFALEPFVSWVTDMLNQIILKNFLLLTYLFFTIAQGLIVHLINITGLMRKLFRINN